MWKVSPESDREIVDGDDGGSEFEQLIRDVAAEESTAPVDLRAPSIREACRTR